MEHVLEKAAVKRFLEAAQALGIKGEIKVLSETAKSAQEAADGLGIAVGQIASSLIFRLPTGGALLVITSGRHRVDTELVAKSLGISELGRVDADFVKEISGYSIGGVSPIGWVTKPAKVIIDEALSEYQEIWAAGGHPHAVFPTTFAELASATDAQVLKVGA